MRRLGLAVLLTLAAASTSAPAASAARFASPSEARALRSAFLHERGHAGTVITAITVSTTAPGWASVAYLPAAQAVAAKVKIITVTREYYRDRPRSHPTPTKLPPKKAKSDLKKDLWVKLTYEGSGSEHYKSTDSGAGECGGSTETSTVTAKVEPAKWKYAYLLDLDKMEREAGGLDPLVRLVSAPTDVSVVRDLEREQTHCNPPNESWSCITTFGAPRNVFPGMVAFTSSGTNILTPMVAASAPQGTGCVDTLGIFGLQPGFTGAAVAINWHLIGGMLPADPYAPIPVTYQRNALNKVNACSTFSGNGPCSDTTEWSGEVTLSHPL
jgi:hypothetical protein